VKELGIEETRMISKVVRPLALAAALIAFTGPAAAWDEIVVERGWAIVAETGDSEDCRAWALSNGKIMRFSAAGLAPGEEVSFHLENDDMRPLDYRLVADGSGTWSKFYVPFRWDRAGGLVTVSMDSASCSLTLSLPWTRQNGGYNSRLAG
jgi:hypothetical protein